MGTREDRCFFPLTSLQIGPQIRCLSYCVAWRPFECQGKGVLTNPFANAGLSWLIWISC
ncbi:unnamed protein product [Musa acuminata subsp. malaccensis]|nr:unnamed protein product [Musa acuminata subsp. malaccensis]CAG1837857.1 unnamed protein product [Musa acuminata subsp. malaccensis]